MTAPETHDGPDPRPELQLEAATDVEFMDMLRDIHTRSRLTGGQVSISSGIPRSTVYRYLDPKTSTLPKNREHVAAFARACKLNTIQVNRVVWLWERLNASTDMVSGDQVVEAELVEPAPPARGGPPGTTVVVHGDYHVMYHPRNRARGSQEHDEHFDDDFGHGEFAGARGHDGDGDGYTRTGFWQFLLAVLEHPRMWMRLMGLFLVAIVGILGLALGLRLLGISATASSAIAMAAIAGLVAVARERAKRTRRSGHKSTKP